MNRKDAEGNNLFEGGFLGVDNIGPFDRSHLPVQGVLEQSDGTAWMASYCLAMLTIAAELAREDRAYDGLVTKFLEHFVEISGARMLTLQGVGDELRRRLIALFLPGPDGRRPVYGAVARYHTDPEWQGLLEFHEYFHGDDGAGLGASHQTGWTGLVAALIADRAVEPDPNRVGMGGQAGAAPRPPVLGPARRV